MQKVKKNAGTARTTVNGDISIVDHVTAHDTLESGYGFQYRTKLDWSDVTDAEKIELASAKVIIDIRNDERWRSCKNPNENQDRTINVREYLDKPRKRRGPNVDKLTKEASRLTNEQRAALIAALTGE